MDAEVGHKELDWKLTVSGVGKCRQVSGQVQAGGWASAGRFWLPFVATNVHTTPSLPSFIPPPPPSPCSSSFISVQVGVPESGVDDAVQKLVARG